MKKYLKKLGVLTLIAAMLAPYVSIPSVEAETSSSNCTTHLKQYMLLDASKLYSREKQYSTEGAAVWLERLASEEYGGYRTFTNFPYDFPSTDSNKVNILDVRVNELTNETSLNTFWSFYLEHVRDVSTPKLLEDYGQTFVNFYDSSKKYNNYDSVSVIFHGKWSNDEHNGDAQQNVVYQELNKADANARSLQNLLTKKTGSNSIINKMDVSLTNARYYDWNETFSGESTEITKNYFQKLVDGVNFPDSHSDYIEDYVYYDESLEQGYFTVKVLREVGLSKKDIETQLNEYTFGYEDSDGVYKIYTENETDTTPTNSYISMKNYKATGVNTGAVKEFKDASGNSIKPEIDTQISYFWPAILSVEYEVCPTSSTPSSTTTTTTTAPQQSGGNANNDVKYWNVQYTAKTEDAGKVTNLPSKHGERLGTNSKVASGVPEKEGFAFKGWCVGTETCTNFVKADDTLTSPDKEGTVILYAQWGEAGPGEQEKTGVMSYVLGLSAVALVAGGIYYVSKKKNLFKQI